MVTISLLYVVTLPLMYCHYLLSRAYRDVSNPGVRQEFMIMYNMGTNVYSAAVHTQHIEYYIINRNETS